MFTHLKSKAIKCIFTIISGHGRPIERWTFNYLNKVAMSAQKSQLEMRKNGIILEHTRDTNANENRRIPRKTICCLNVSENSRCFIAILFPFGSIVWIGRCWKDAMNHWLVIIIETVRSIFVRIVCHVSPSFIQYTASIAPFFVSILYATKQFDSCSINWCISF